MSVLFSGRGVLLDIEGTAGSLAFVRETLFPYAQRELRAFLARRWSAPEVAAAREQIARDAGAESFQAWLEAPPDDGPGPVSPRERLAGSVLRLMQADAKRPGLKLLQGLIWEEGYHSGALRAHVYPDVPPALAAWKAAGLKTYIYSSGSIHAQNLYFAHTRAGDLRPFLDGNFDTLTGPKREAASYAAIADAMRLPAGEILFVSDAPAELAAARRAGLAVALAVRPGNPAPPLEAERFPWLESFAEVLPVRRAAPRLTQFAPAAIAAP